MKKNTQHMNNMPHSETINVILEQIILAWTDLQHQCPLIHCITNHVAANYAANVLLAAGASPAMIDNPYEAESFAQIASAININLGTPTTEQMQAMEITAQTAQRVGTPWVLDPVGYGPVLSWRSNMVNSLLAFHPTVIRGNASEISTLAGHQAQAKGVDSTLESSDIYLQAIPLLAHTDCIAISGQSDFIIAKDLDYAVKINGGSKLQPKITATGCALGALVAAYSAVCPASIAAIAAHVHFAIAGKLADQLTQSVGHFNVAFLDHIQNLDVPLLRQYTNLEIYSIKAK